MNITGYTLLEIIKLVKKRQITIPEVTSFFYNRIKKFNQRLNAFITVLDYQQIKPGIPIAVKDNFCTKGIKTTAASKVLADFISPYESTVTDKLIKNGLTIIGKTNMDAWAHGSSTETSDFGPTKNPWNIDYSPGGSSGGSVAAVSAYLVPAAIGSETAGSIRQPASWSGVIGLKPTYGRVSRYGLIAMGSSLDCPGPLTISVADAAFLLKVIAGKDNYDATTSFQEVPDYLKKLEKNQKFVIGITDEYFEGVLPEIKNKIFTCLNIFRKLGHKIKKIKLISPKYAISVYTIIQRAEVSSNLARYDGIRFGNPREFLGSEAKKRIMLGTYTLSHGYYESFYKKAQQFRTLIIEDYIKAFKEVDFIISPTTPTTAFKLGEFEKYPFFGELMDMLNEPASVAGLPAINLPAGLDKNNLPIGMQIVGPYFYEDRILNLANQFEKETDYFGVIKKGILRYQ
ncbi:MAG: amidase family protein [Microgenomates group bacterium]|nr:amidase family protein [Microgenomates group bacterium]